MPKLKQSMHQYRNRTCVAFSLIMSSYRTKQLNRLNVVLVLPSALVLPCGALALHTHRPDYIRGKFRNEKHALRRSVTKAPLQAANCQSEIKRHKAPYHVLPQMLDQGLNRGRREDGILQFWVPCDRQQ